MLRYGLPALVAGSVLLTGACDGSQDTELEPIGVRRIEVAGVWVAGEQAKFMSVLDEYTARYGVVVDYTTLDSKDVAGAVDDRIAENSQPDVALLPQPGLIRRLADCGDLVPLPLDVSWEVHASYPSPELRAPGVVGGRMYGVWFKAANKSILWYDPAAFRAAGVSPPRTWDQLLEASESLYAQNAVPPLSIGAAPADGWVLTDWFENALLQVAGEAKYDRLARRDLSWTDPSVIRSLESLAELWRDEWIVGGRAGALDTPYRESISQVFTRGEGAMVFEGNFVASDIPAYTPERARFFPFPTMTSGAPRAVVAAGDVAVMMKDSAEARDLMRFLADPASAEIWAARGGFISPNENVDPDAYGQADRVGRWSAATLHRAPVVRFDLSDQLPSAMGSTPRAGMWQSMREFLAEPSDPADTAQAIEARARRFDTATGCPERG